MRTHVKKNGGFTLVELIVVIAILAILAAVAVPAYNGYIDKANKAKDDQLIAAINKAAATAVLEANGEDMINLIPGELVSNATKGSSEPICVERKNAKLDAAKTAAVKTAFEKFFAGNENAALKWYGSLKFDGDKFVGVTSVLSGSLVVPEDSNVVNSFNSSSYAVMGVDKMTGMVDNLAGALAAYSNLNLVTETDAFKATLTKLGINPATADEQTMANAAVFYLADYTSQLNQADIWTHVQDGDLQEWLTADAGLGLAQNDAIFLDTAIRYAVATSYAYSDSASPEVREIIEKANPTNRGEALTVIQQVTDKNKSGWLNYISDDTAGAKNGMNDFAAFYEVMGVVNASNGSFSNIESSNLFSNAELQAAINSILGNAS